MQKAFLSDEQWKKIEPLLPRDKSRGRSWADNRRVLEGVLWVLKVGARWRDLPKVYPSAATCWGSVPATAAAYLPVIRLCSRIRLSSRSHTNTTCCNGNTHRIWNEEVRHPLNR